MLFFSSAAFASEPAFNFESLRNLIFSSNTKGIEQTLPLIGQQYPDYSRFYTLMYASDSLHQTTFEKPRVIMFGRDARFVLTFNGSSRLRSGNSFEMMEFSEATQSFVFREITFKSETYDPNDRLKLKPEEIEFENRDLVISKPNPFKCLQCHGSNASPLWASAFLWPGAYGSVANNLYLNFAPGERRAVDAKMWESATSLVSQGAPMFLKKGIADMEAEGMLRYLSEKPVNERYKWLPVHPSETGFLRFARGENFKSIDLTDVYRAENKSLNIGEDWPMRPNRFLQRQLMKLNNARLLNDIKKAGIPAGAYAAGDWASLEDAALRRDGIRTIEQAAVQVILALRPIKTMKPDRMQVAAALRWNLRDEMLAQFMTISTHDDNFGSSAFEVWREELRQNLGWIGEPYIFYASLLQKKSATETEKIAMISETGNQVITTALATLLKQKGIDLHDYTMTLNQRGLNFYSGGLADVAEYLGLPKNENY